MCVAAGGRRAETPDVLGRLSVCEEGVCVQGFVAGRDSSDARGRIGAGEDVAAFECNRGEALLVHVARQAEDGGQALDEPAIEDLVLVVGVRGGWALDELEGLQEPREFGERVPVGIGPLGVDKALAVRAEGDGLVPELDVGLHADGGLAEVAAERVGGALGEDQVAGEPLRDRVREDSPAHSALARVSAHDARAGFGVVHVSGAHGGHPHGSEAVRGLHWCLRLFVFECFYLCVVWCQFMTKKRQGVCFDA